MPVMKEHIDGQCDWCQTPLPPRRRRWCSNKCSLAVYRAISRNHDWNDARKAALARDGKCVRCGKDWRALMDAAKAERDSLRAAGQPADLDAISRRYQLEVNHIIPRVGQGYKFGCWNHLDNLETLCHSCHVAETNKQRQVRKQQNVDAEDKHEAA